MEYRNKYKALKYIVKVRKQQAGTNSRFSVVVEEVVKPTDNPNYVVDVRVYDSEPLPEGTEHRTLKPTDYVANVRFTATGVHLRWNIRSTIMELHLQKSITSTDAYKQLHKDTIVQLAETEFNRRFPSNI